MKEKFSRNVVNEDGERGIEYHLIELADNETIEDIIYLYYDAEGTGCDYDCSGRRFYYRGIVLMQKDNRYLIEHRWGIDI